MIVCLGTINTIKVENLNTLLDDNKCLVLASGERYPLPKDVRIVFDTDDLSQASPAFVSRVNCIYVD